MEDYSHYTAVVNLRDGRILEIRALRPDDREGLLAAADHTSALSLYRRFFSSKRHFSDTEVAYFLNVDFMNHVALVAVATDKDERVIVGGARYVVIRPGQAEVAATVVDGYQGQGIGAALVRHLIEIARRRGLTELTAEILRDNAPMLKVFERCGLPLSKSCEGEAVHVLLQLG